MATLSPVPSSVKVDQKNVAPTRPWVLVLQALLFVCTCVTTTAVGMLYMANFRAGLAPLSSAADIFPFAWAWAHRAAFADGLPFSITLLAILLAHEFGHYFAARAFDVDTSLPFVLPSPSLTGSMGAVIRLRSSVRTRKALLVIASCGPIAGFIVAAPAAVLGLALSVPVKTAPVWLVPFNEPPLLLLLRPVLSDFFGMNRGGALLWHPVLVASWFGLLITALNLVPAGQLDGGHILYTLSPRVHTVATRTAIVGLGILGVFVWSPWLLWMALLLLPGMRRPYVYNRRRGFMITTQPHDRRAGRGSNYIVLAPICMVIALLCALPLPFANASLLQTIHWLHR